MLSELYVVISQQ